MHVCMWYVWCVVCGCGIGSVCGVVHSSVCMCGVVCVSKSLFSITKSAAAVRQACMSVQNTQY